MRFGFVLLLVTLLVVPFVAADPGFDLAGPRVDVRVEREGKTLPIAEVPNLQAGDRVWIHPDLPESQSARYVMIVAFLRGATNPPPDSWFNRYATWDKSVREEGVFVTVPADAQQALIFLAPETGGGFSTLRAAVRGRPGAFVRAAQDLQQASLDRLRLDRYLHDVKSISENEPAALHDRSVLLARSLKIKLDANCFDRPAEQQLSCLTQNTDQLILDDPHSQSMVAQLANGATADLMNQLSYSRIAGGGAYSAYVGAVVDLARIMGSIHNAQYQYIPALALPERDSLNLRLNNPPSFRKPMSVLVVGLPTVQKAQMPPLRPVDRKQRFCADEPRLVLPVEGAPLIFASHLAHDLTLKLKDETGKEADLPIEADPSKGGFVVDTAKVASSGLGRAVIAEVQGRWGFDRYLGPQFDVEVAQSGSLALGSADSSALVVGRTDTLHLHGDVQCVSGVKLNTANGAVSEVKWKAQKPGNLQLEIPLEKVSPGDMQLEISQYGLPKPDVFPLRAYGEAAQFDAFILNSGDDHGELEGKRLDEVADLALNGIRFGPVALRRAKDRDELAVKTSASTAGLAPGSAQAKVTLKDGRSLTVPATINGPRPRVELVSKGVQNTDDAAGSSIHLGSSDDLPASARIVFFVRSLQPENFPRGEKIEVASADESFKTMLSMDDGRLILQDSRTALGILDPEKAFGASGFGAVRFRAIAPDGRAGDWQPLGTIVRLPDLKELRCPVSTSKGCVLDGSDLFLLAAVSSTEHFDDSSDVPDAFTGTSIEVGRADTGTLYLKLRDDPDTVQSVTVPVVRGSATSANSNTKADNSLLR